MPQKGLDLQPSQSLWAVIVEGCDGCPCAVAGDCSSRVGPWQAGFITQERDQNRVEVLGSNPSTAIRKQQINQFVRLFIEGAWLRRTLLLPRSDIPPNRSEEHTSELQSRG